MPVSCSIFPVSSEILSLCPRCYFSKETKNVSTELHGFCDASEQAYAAVVYLRMTDTDGNVQIALVTSKTKVAPIKRLVHASSCVQRFETYVGNRVSCIVELIGSGCLQGIETPADCASRGLFPSELLDHALWWNGPTWLRMHSSAWPHQLMVPDTET